MALITTLKERINQLNPASFQILCDELLAKEGYPNLVALGTQDGAEKTTSGTPDTYCCLSNGKYVFVEYTTQKDGLVAKIHTDIGKCLDTESTGVPLEEISEIVYCHTSSNIKPADDRSLKLRCEENGIKLTLLGIDLLAEKLMYYPSIIKRNLGLSIDTEQIQSADEFVQQYDSNAMAATLETGFLFRENEIKSINEAFSKVNTVLLVGPAGTGKTRLALEYARNHESTHNERLFCIHDRSMPMYEDLKQYFEKPGEYFVFIDDANQLSELKHVVEYANKMSSGYYVRILMTVRDYAISKVRLDIDGIVNYEVINVTAFTDEEISTLMKNHYGIQNPNYLERIVQIAEGNARIAMLAGKVASDANRLDSINDVSDLYESYFGRALHEVGVDSNAKLLVSAGIMAFLNAIHLDHIAPIMPVLDENGLSVQDFIDNIHILHDHEIVDICNDKGVRFSEQCIANFVLKYVFFDKKIIKFSTMIEASFDTYRERTIHAVNTLLSVFRNADLQNYVEEEILTLWKKLENENSPVFFDYLKVFFPINEIQTLLLLKRRIAIESPVYMRAEDVNTEDGRNFQSVNDDIIMILGGFSHLENLDAALDLFFQHYLKRPDLYIQFYHAATSSFSIDKNSIESGFQTQIQFFAKIIEYCKSGTDVQNALVELLFIDIADHFLQFTFSPSKSTRNGKGIAIYHIPINLTPGVTEYRELIWKQLLSLATKPQYHKKIKGILQGYGKSGYDCCKEVIYGEADYVCALSELILSPGHLTDCLIAKSLRNVFKVAEYQTNMFQQFLESSTYRLYQLIIGPKWEPDIPHAEYQMKKEIAIREFIMSASDKIATFQKIVQLFTDTADEKSRKMYEIAEGINIAIQVLKDSPEDYICCISMLLTSKTITGIETKQIVKPLFTMLSPQRVYDLLSRSFNCNRNQWLYTYYHEIPRNCITQEELNGLYKFLMDDSDRVIKLSPYRDIDFLDKYLPIDDSVIITASEIIYKKKEYSPFMVSIYFEQLFNEYSTPSRDVIQKFSQDIKLLEKIYLYVKEIGNVVDYTGGFLRLLFETDKAFIKEYAKWMIKQSEKISSYDENFNVVAFYLEKDYLSILDYIVDESILSAPYPGTTVPRIIEKLLALPDEYKEETEKRNCWIRHFIESNYADKDKMCFIFEALTEVSIKQTTEYVALLVKCTKEYDIFKAIPLTPCSYSTFGSCVPLYSAWVEHLEELLQFLHGVDYIEHRTRVEELIRYYRKSIKEEEISEILRG